MPARHAVLLTLPSAGNRPHWSYHHTGTLLRLISFVSHSYANTGGVRVFFPFWYKTIGSGDANSLHYSSSFFSHSCALFCSFLHFPKAQPFSFQSLPHSLPKNTRGGYTCASYALASLLQRESHTSCLLSLLANSKIPTRASRGLGRGGLGVSSGASLQPSTFNSQLSPLHVQFPPRVPGRRHEL